MHRAGHLAQDRQRQRRLVPVPVADDLAPARRRSGAGDGARLPGGGLPRGVGLLCGGSGEPGLLCGGSGEPGLLRGGSGEPGLLRGGSGEPGLLCGGGEPGLLCGGGEPGLLCGGGEPGLLGGGESGLLRGGESGLLHGGSGKSGLRDRPPPAREETARGGEPWSSRAHPGQAVRIVGPARDTGGGPGSADQQDTRGGVIREILPQHGFVGRVAGPLGPRMGVHVGQPGEQPAAVRHGVSARGGLLAEHPAVDPQRPLLPLWEQRSAHVQHHEAVSTSPAREPQPAGPDRILDTAADMLNGMGRAS